MKRPVRFSSSLQFGSDQDGLTLPVNGLAGRYPLLLTERKRES